MADGFFPCLRQRKRKIIKAKWRSLLPSQRGKLWSRCGKAATRKEQDEWKRRQSICPSPTDKAADALGHTGRHRDHPLVSRTRPRQLPAPLQDEPAATSPRYDEGRGHRLPLSLWRGPRVEVEGDWPPAGRQPPGHACSAGATCRGDRGGTRWPGGCDERPTAIPSSLPAAPPYCRTARRVLFSPPAHHPLPKKCSKRRRANPPPSPHPACQRKPPNPAPAQALLRNDPQ